jgi:outer membrane protein assembly factor BamB
MSCRALAAATLCAVRIGLPAFAGDCTSTGDWPQFRGRQAAGVAHNQDAPVHWNAETGSNIRWKTAIPGLGHASPVVSGSCVFIVTAISSDPAPRLRPGLYGDIAPVEDDTSHCWQLYCLCKYNGRILWKRALHEGVPKIKRHPKATHANSTPATDGIRLVVFLGSEGLYCYDLCGNLLWKRDLGVLDSGFYRSPAAQWGFASSPIIYRNMVIVQCDVQENSFLAAFNVCNGRQMWRTPRQDVPTWSTPTIYEGGTRPELIVNGYEHAGGYDPWTGKELWKLSGGGDIPVPTPLVAHGLIFLSSAHGRQRPLCAVRLGATGDIKPGTDGQPSASVAWYKQRDGIYIQTPIVYGEHLYACRNSGVLSCYETRTGERLYRERLGRGGTGFTASPVAADGKLYFTSEDGDVYVVRVGSAFEILATNQIGEVCMATPAISDGMIIVRAKNHVYGIGEPRGRSVLSTGRPLGSSCLIRGGHTVRGRRLFRAGSCRRHGGKWRWRSMVCSRPTCKGR